MSVTLGVPECLGFLPVFGWFSLSLIYDCVRGFDWAWWLCSFDVWVLGSELGLFDLCGVDIV